MAVDEPHPRRGIIVGINGGNLGDPCEMRQVEVEERVFQIIACGPLGEVAPVASGGCQVCPQDDAVSTVGCQQLVHQHVVYGHVAIGKDWTGSGQGLQVSID